MLIHEVRIYRSVFAINGPFLLHAPQFSTSTNTYRNKLFYQKLVSVLTMKFLFLNSVKPQLTETLGE